MENKVSNIYKAIKENNKQYLSQSNPPDVTSTPQDSIKSLIDTKIN